MRKRLVSETYTRDVEKFNFVCDYDDETGCYIALKEIIKIKKPIFAYSNGNKYCGVNDGYSILEVVPKDKGYNFRVFFDDHKRALLIYFDINNGAGIENGIAWYDDLYLDVTLSLPIITGGFEYIYIDDEYELEEALKEKSITQKDFDFAWNVATKLIEELKAHTNIFVNRIQLYLQKLSGSDNKQFNRKIKN